MFFSIYIYIFVFIFAYVYIYIYLLRMILEIKVISKARVQGGMYMHLVVFQYIKPYTAWLLVSKLGDPTQLPSDGDCLVE